MFIKFKKSVSTLKFDITTSQDLYKINKKTKFKILLAMEEKS